MKNLNFLVAAYIAIWADLLRLSVFRGAPHGESAGRHSPLETRRKVSRPRDAKRMSGIELQNRNPKTEE